MEFRILGSLEAEDGGGLVRCGPSVQKVLALLLLDAGREVPLSRLVAGLWDDDAPDTAVKQARNAVGRLRRVLAAGGAPQLIVTDGAGYRIRVADTALDASRFEATVMRAQSAASQGQRIVAADLLRSALGLWRGPFLAGMQGRVIEAAAAAWNERRYAVTEMYFDYELESGRHHEVVADLSAFAGDHPLRERPAGQLMLALYRCGRQADALAVYAATRQLLVAELGVEPGPQLRGLHQQLLAGQPAVAGSHRSSAGASHRPGAGAARPFAGVPQVRYSLPTDTVAFTGRTAELDQIAAAVPGAGGVVAVGAIDGMPGVGKTALAVRAAHMLAADFPDRQLFIDLHGHTPGHDPVRPGDALAGLLAAVGVDTRQLPGDLNALAAMWRDRIAGQRMLLVLDNAASSDQVVPLLPGRSDCLVLVTSRRHLGDLPGALMPVVVDVLPPREAAQMFTGLAPRAAADQEGVAELVRLAGCLPLALGLLARVFSRHPSWTLADLANETRAGVLTMTAENTTIGAAFEVSYRHLDPEAQRLFRLLGVHPGTAVDGYAAAALAGIRARQAAVLLDGLYREGLLTETSYHRYGMHDLLRRYAVDLTSADTPGEVEQALARLLDYYQYTTALVGQRLARLTRPGPGPSGPVEFDIPVLDTARHALDLIRADRASLIACLNLVTRSRQHDRIVALSAGMSVLLRRDGGWAEAITRHTAAAESARYQGDRLGEAGALTDLGDVWRMTGDHPAAVEVLGRARDIYRDLGSRLGEANTLHDLGSVQRLTDDYPGAAVLLEQALRGYRDLGDHLGQASALRELGIVRWLTDDYRGADQVLNEALGIYGELGDQLGQAHAWHELGSVRQLTGDYAGAAQALEQALTGYRDLGDRLDEANALTDLATVRQRTGDNPAAVALLEHALDLYRHLGSRLGEANVLRELGTLRQLAGDYPAAGALLEQVLHTYRNLGTRLGEANTLTSLGVLRRLTGDYPGAARAAEEAVAILSDLGDRQGQAEALHEQGTLYQVTGDLARAQGCHQQALDLARAIGSSRDEAVALANLGRCARAVGNTTRAAELLRQACQIFQQIGAAEARDVRAELDSLTGRPSLFITPVAPIRAGSGPPVVHSEEANRSWSAGNGAGEGIPHLVAVDVSGGQGRAREDPGEVPAQVADEQHRTRVVSGEAV